MLEREFCGKQGLNVEEGERTVGGVDEKGKLITEGPKKRLAVRWLEALLSLTASISSIYTALIIKPAGSPPPSKKLPVYVLYVLSVLTFLGITYLFLIYPCCCGARRHSEETPFTEGPGGIMVLPVQSLPGGNKHGKGGKKKKGGGEGGEGVQVNLIVDPTMFGGGNREQEDEDDGSDVPFSSHSSSAGRRRRAPRRRGIFAGLAMEAQWKRARKMMKWGMAVDMVVMLLWGTEFVLILLGQRCPSGSFDGWCDAYNIATAAACLLCLAFGFSIFFDIKDLHASGTSRGHGHEKLERVLSFLDTGLGLRAVYDTDLLISGYAFTFSNFHVFFLAIEVGCLRSAPAIVGAMYTDPSILEPVRRSVLLATIHELHETPNFLASAVSAAARNSTESVRIVIVSPFFDPAGGISHTALWDEVQRLLTFVYVQATKVAQDVGNPLLDIDVLLKGSAEHFPEELTQAADRIFSVTPHDTRFPVLPASVERRRTEIIALAPDDHPLHTPLPPAAPADPSVPPLYPVVALGGTFDHLHAGHKILLSMGAWIARDKLIVGITDDALLVNKAHREVLEPLPVRTARVRAFLELFRPGVFYDLVPISDVYGPTGWDPNVQALVVSRETLPGASSIDKRRREQALPPLRTFVIDVISATEASVDAEDAELLKSTKMSSTFIREWIVEKQRQTGAAR
ncbi:Phosphopantetheine adenylyltransferase [Grifola frondosa]|uniref:Phosphopantetheine adenylyltransferase n=1 Tax=Grifola frondosa TaxID=5627 RepID=A0A1C7LX00_GRIFR|nr:Phosphopantetheine adenylyltransferase [Grifola frondosa]